MFTGLLLVCLAVASGLAVSRAPRVPLSLAPLSGLAAMAVLTVWCSALKAPPLLATGLVVLLALVGVATTALRWGAPPCVGTSDTSRALRGRQGRFCTARSPRSVTAGQATPLASSPGKPASVFTRTSLRETWACLYACRWPLLLLAVAVATPALLLGAALAGVDAPVSTHDGAFHVETIDLLRHGDSIQMWYPVGFHTTAAALLGLVPWLDTARGTVDVALGLAMLAPLALCTLGVSIGLRPLQASVGALVLALTYVFPYDDHMWAGYPLAMSIVLLLGLWAVAVHWTTEPSAALAILGGLLAGAIVLTHGTEVYSASIGLAVIAAVRWRRIKPTQLLRHLPVAIACALLCAAPYLTALLGFASAGGATSAGVAALDDIAAHPEITAGGDWLEFMLGVTGAASFIDLPVRAVLLVIGMRGRHMRLVVAAWAIFSGVLFAVSFLDLAPIRWLYVVTFPWLVHHRPPQMVVLFASLLIASGLATTIGWLWSLRPRLVSHPHAWRRLVIVSGILLAFFAEGSAISIYKTLDQVIVEQNAYSPDDVAAMAWLKVNAQPGELIVNDQAADAGIWAPYKTGAPILLPRSGSGPLIAERLPVLTHLLDLPTTADARSTACALHTAYVYSGGKPVPGDTQLLPTRAVLEGVPHLEEVFASGQAAVFRLHLSCT